MTKATLLLLLSAAAFAQAPALTPAPSPSLNKDSQCYELRTYTAAPGKLEALHARFRNHTIALFKKHGVNVAGFWGPVNKEQGAADTLIYLCVFPTCAAKDKAWAAFRQDPDWIKARKESEVNGPLTTKVESRVLNSTDYAPVK